MVFLDANWNGARDAGEPGRPGVAVTNGRELVRTDEQGRYALPERAEGFVAITRPDGFVCTDWARPGGGDFALAPATAAEAADGFFFVQISDVHAYERASDFADFSVPPVLGWVPDALRGWVVLRFLTRAFPGTTPESIAELLRDGLAPYRDTAGASDDEVVDLWAAEFASAGSELGAVERHVREAIGEVANLAPRFVISTGDLVLEGNGGSAEAVERWFAFYGEVTGGTGIPFHDTIGNNEIAGNQREDFAPDDPGYGKQTFRRFYGPTHYSFDRGPFHFVALDTHRPEPGFWDEEYFAFGRMEPAIRDWLDADLSAHADRVLVVLNHEPFHVDPAWPGSYEPADDEGLFAKHGVDYVLTGHIHWNSIHREAETTHVTTGALSGFRWYLPEDLHPRGYRLFYAREGRLHHAWKRLGQPLLEIVEVDEELVVAAADVAGPFERVELTLDGEALPLERWGDYFGRAPRPAGGGTLVLTAHRADGPPLRTERRLP